MTPGAQLNASIEVLDSFLLERAPLDNALRRYFRNRRFIGSKDRQAITGYVYDAIRHLLPLQWWGAETARHVMLAVLVFLRKEKDPASFFDGSKYAPGTLTEEEVGFLKSIENQELYSKDQPEAVQLNCPDWAYEKIKISNPEDYKPLLEALNEQAPFDLRVNTLKTDRDTILQWLEEQNLYAVALQESSAGIRLLKRHPIEHWQPFKEGWIEVQDENSQRVADILQAKPGERVVDFCAGAGGKTLAIAADMKNKGSIYALDTSAGRLKRAKVRFNRAGVHNVQTHTLKDENDPWLKRHAGKFDAVLVDAPCSGSGTWRRNPDAKWRYDQSALDDFAALQQNILQAASKLVKPGGRILYVTCSVFNQENMDQVRAFNENNPSYKCLETQAFMPHCTSGDGFFVALWRKI